MREMQKMTLLLRLNVIWIERRHLCRYTCVHIIYVFQMKMIVSSIQSLSKVCHSEWTSLKNHFNQDSSNVLEGVIFSMAQCSMLCFYAQCSIKVKIFVVKMMIIRICPVYKCKMVSFRYILCWIFSLNV